MAFEYKRIDVDSHCQEKPDAWTSRMSKAKWGDRIPQIVEKDGREIWMCDGRVMMNGWLSLCHGVIPDRKSLPTHWRRTTFQEWRTPAGLFRDASGALAFEGRRLWW